jgi:hypothetical protein
MRIILTTEERAEITRGAQAGASFEGDAILQSVLPAIELDLLREFWDTVPVILRAILAHAETEADEPLTAEGELANNLAEIRKASEAP